MIKKYSLTFWIIFWLTSAILLTLWYVYLNTQKKGISATIDSAVNFLPMDVAQKNELQSLTKIGDFLLRSDDQEKTVMVLFLNNMEIRPGGGFIGAFGIVKIKNGEVISMETHDLSNFDGRIPDTVTPPYPMQETLAIKSWKLRDSNYSPDFEINAQKAMEFYYMGDGQEKFDAIIGITTNVLTSMLKVTGPIEIEGYPGTYDSDNAVLALEYQVEKAFDEQGIDRGERKSIMSDLAKEIEKRVFDFSISQKVQLAKILLTDLNQKDIQLYFANEELQNFAENSGWAGKVDQNWDKDFLMISDANLGSFKSDYYIKRSVDYTVDLSKEIPTAKLKISYEHTAKQKDWMTRDYTDYLRVYVPTGAWLVDQKNFDNTKFGDEFGKKYFGSLIRVPIESMKTVEINYTLPITVKEEYNLKIQKQAGLNNIPVTFHLTKSDGTKDGFSKTMNNDIVFK
ncbi:MAG: hypothetical protein ACD_8C00103G0001 [uncultured bacterium]|nr:MAG: hypothetical protein ACD_8C00103G0001 [uncultured bacterium]